MSIERKLYLLDNIYRLYDNFIRSQPLACQPSCAACCTCNVTLTTLEGYRILSSLSDVQKEKLPAVIRRGIGRQRFQPKLTFNQIAARCRENLDVPEETVNPDWGVCPLLVQLRCPIYAQRPFGCRAMVSRVPCHQSGYADMNAFILSVNNLFLQYIEHIDTPGMTGNLVDIFCFLEIENNRKAYRYARISWTPENLIPNSHIPVIMIPPEHRARIRPVLNSLQALLE